MFTELKTKIQETEACITSAINAEKTARKSYLDSCSEHRGIIDGKLTELQDELVAERAENELRPQRMADALSQGDIECATAVENEINSANVKITELEHKIQLLSMATPKGDPALFSAAIKAHREKIHSITAAIAELKSHKYQTEILFGDLMAIQEDIRNKINSTLHLTGRQPDLNLIEMVETFEGPIDVRHHAAFNDVDAKMRYVSGVLAGIENTPAGRVLATQLGEGVKS